MTDNYLGKTFFPGTRKQLTVKNLSLLRTRGGETRIQLGLTMPLSDGKLVGLPSWVGDAYDDLAVADSQQASTKFVSEMDAMTLYIFSSTDSDAPAQTVFNVLLNTFSLRREAQDAEAEEASGVNLVFVAYVPFSQEALGWLARHFHETIFVRFDTTQAALFEKPVSDAQMELPVEVEG
jgi:hypothetical protein